MTELLLVAGGFAAIGGNIHDMAKGRDESIWIYPGYALGVGNLLSGVIFSAIGALDDKDDVALYFGISQLGHGALCIISASVNDIGADQLEREEPAASRAAKGALMTLRF